MLKKCSKCGIEKELTEFNKHKSRKDGLQPQCKECIAEYYATHKKEAADYRAKNKDKIKEVMAEYYTKNKKKIKESVAEYRAKNKDKIKEIMAEYHTKNKEKLKEYDANYRAKNKEKLKEYQKSPKGKEASRKSKLKYLSKPENQAKYSKREFLTFVCKDYILARDNFQCQLCPSRDKLIIHHILPVQHDLDDKNILNPKNLVTLCPECHKKAHNYFWKSLNLKIAQQLLTLIRAKEDIKPTILPKYDPEELVL
jgi:DNA mismatch repair ATPase MutL